jgi:hypothetical protein
VKPAAPVHHARPKPSPATTDSSTTVASNGTGATSASAIGQLSEGDSSTSGGARSETARLIDSTEEGLRGITRPLSLQEQKTAAQVRKFLFQARDALHSQNVDAAHTLATKAKLLLDELLK